MTEFRIADLIEESLRTVEPLIKSDSVRLETDIDPEFPLMLSDADKLRQILINLLSNAIKFTSQGSVTVRARRRDSTLMLAVEDTGIGIPAEALERVFQAFQQVDASTTREYGGTGLGLTITRQLTHLLGGDIAVESAVGGGSTFTAMLPVRFVSHPVETSAVAPEQAPGPIEVGGNVILAIDDDPNAVYLLGEALREEGFRVVGANRGEEGLRLARELKPLAITLDVVMSPPDGWQVLHQLKSDRETRGIPVVVISIVDQKPLAYRLGAAAYVDKPFDSDVVVASLRTLCPPEGRVLVIDDDAEVVHLVRQLLGDTKYRIDWAVDGEEGLAMIRRAPPDVILLDLMMPKMDGFAVINRLHEDPALRDIPTIVITAKLLDADEKARLREHKLAVLQKSGLERQFLLQELRRVVSPAVRADDWMI